MAAFLAQDILTVCLCLPSRLAVQGYEVAVLFLGNVSKLS